MLDTMSEKLKVSNSSRSNDIILALAVISMTFLLVLPLTPIVLDALVTLSIVLGITILLVTLYSEDSLSFSSFPSLLLIITLFRLGLNIAATRMILTEAQAGEIIKTFGLFVTGGSQLVGFLIFILITGVNFVVITKGSGRVAEVAARFNLDALPGKQMAIDADVNAGIINENQAQMRREKVIAESDFYGAMDGASKFVRGDAIAAIVITIVNIVGGFIVGMGMRGLSWDQATSTYMTLAIGDGLVTQIPALLISIAAGIIVTRSSSRQHLGELFKVQVFNNPRVLNITAGFLILLSLVPGMPKLVIFSVAGTLFLYAQALKRVQKKPFIEQATAATTPEMEAGSSGKEVEKVLFIDPMELEIGEKLSSLAHDKLGDALLTRISTVRRQIASEMGIVVPSIRIHGNPFLPPDTYVVKIKGNEVDSYVLYLDMLLAVNPGHVMKPVNGINTTEPAFKLPATWITQDLKPTAESFGYAIADPLSVLSTHLTEIIHTHAYELLNRQEVARLIAHAKVHAPAVVDELIPRHLSLGDVLKVLQNLLRERVSIRDIVSILEILADNCASTHDTEVLTEYVRIGLARTISKQYMDQNKIIHAIVIDPKVEQMMLEGIQKNEFGKQIVLNPSASYNISQLAKDISMSAASQGIQAVMLTSSSLRPYVKKFVERTLPYLPVLAFNEITSEVQIQTIGVISPDVLMQ